MSWLYKKTKPNNSNGQGTSQTNISTTCSDWDTCLPSVKLISLVYDIPNGEIESWQLHRNGFWFACSKGDIVESFQIHRCTTSGRWWGGVKLRDLIQIRKRISCAYRKTTYFGPCNGSTILDVESDSNYFLVQPTAILNFFLVILVSMRHTKGPSLDQVHLADVFLQMLIHLLKV